MKHNWTYKKLNEVCEKASSNIALNKIENNIGEYPLYGASGLVKHIDFYHKDKPYIGIIKDGAGVGRVGKYPAKSSLVGTMQYIHPNEEICHIDYLYFALQSLHLNESVTGATIPHIYFKDYGKLSIPIPSLDEQQAIVRELDGINRLIDLQEEQLREYDRLAQSLFYSTFGDPATNPKGWEVKKYGDIFEISSGGTPSKKVSSYWKNGNIPWIGSNMCQNCVIYETDGKYITQEGLNHSSAKLLPKNTVLVALVGATIGKVALLKTESSTNQNIAFVKPHKDFAAYFVYFHLMNQYDEFMNIGNGDFKMATQGFIKGLGIMCPPLALQQSFAVQIEAIEQQKALIRRSLDNTRTLLAARMQYYFN